MDNITDEEFYARDEKVEISKFLLSELIGAAGYYRMMYNDWIAGVMPEDHPDLNAVEYLLEDADRIRQHARMYIPELTETTT